MLSFVVIGAVVITSVSTPAIFLVELSSGTLSGLVASRWSKLSGRSLNYRLNQWRHRVRPQYWYQLSWTSKQIIILLQSLKKQRVLSLPEELRFFVMLHLYLKLCMINALLVIGNEFLGILIIFWSIQWLQNRYSWGQEEKLNVSQIGDTTMC